MRSFSLLRRRHLGFLGLLCCGFSLFAQAGEIKGVAVYRERIALTPSARLEVLLEEVPANGQTATLIADLQLEAPGQPPIAFSLPFDDARIVPERHYQIRARVLDRDQLLFNSDAPVPVVPGENDTPLKLSMHMPAETAQASAAILEDLPATFKGVLSCAACDGIQHHLNLLPNHVWFLRQSWIGSNETPNLDQLGRWELDEHRRALRLIGATEAPMMLAIGNEDGLMKLDIVGQLRESHTDQALKRAPKFEPFSFQGIVRGMYRENADGASFTECLSGQRWTPAEGPEQRVLHAAYERLKLEHDQPVLASVDAELSADGAAPPRFKVREYNGVWPKETCVQAGTPPPLENTYWKLTRLDGKPVMTPANAREAYVVLKAPNQLTGHAGCNRLGGRYSLKRGELGFRGAVMTRMACLVEQDTESKLMNALKETSNWSIEGQYLHLFNAEGQQLARFEAVYLR